ncbi:YbjQ family protein [Natrinema sp. HArc-T2]|uniref:YbjQ family protein n=1 Tax=Natrinema sp. HArc-T2 TaxID=3242701 RepID=UPI00359D9219
MTEPDVTITTTDSLEGREITEYLGVISGEAVIGANVMSDIAAGIRDVVGGRSGSYEKKIENGRREAIKDLQADAKERGADAVVGATFDYEEMGEGMLWVNLSGTAVTTRRE